MACYFPFAVRDPKATFRDVKGWINVPCGKCPDCLVRRSNMWQVRLVEEDKISSSSLFVTLTYDPEHCPISENGFMTLDKSDVQKFMKRLRKISPSGKKIRYYAAGEYGEKFSRPHYHMILFDADKELVRKAWSLEKKEIGDVHIGEASGAAIAYTLKYIHKGKVVPVHGNDDRVPEFALMSKDWEPPTLLPQKSNIT